MNKSIQEACNVAMEIRMSEFSVMTLPEMTLLDMLIFGPSNGLLPYVLVWAKEQDEKEPSTLIKYILSHSDPRNCLEDLREDVIEPRLKEAQKKAG